ncbi:uncharacterized protein LOC119498553 [Sebastes umbrosus]|uniref:uncharacterized protein LOC119498553 n=1 Tax=Sebastes umbrosus TaxID=72105 RepID=UPI00189CD0EC|nr:uncharacterized protein LOC119498553 [Sebastes umbrosus]
MRFSLVLAALLCFTTWMSVGHATNGPVASCCLGWSNTLQGLPLERILDYTIQSDGVCLIKAVVFKTTRGKRICSDPNSDRAKKAILKVDEEKKKKEALQEKGQNEEGLTSDITPTVSTTAVVFQTTRGVGIYSDPNSEEKAILKVDEEKKEVLQEKGQNEEGLTSDITPTVSTTAVAFLTKLGKRICSNPNSDWAKRTILKVDEEKKKEKALQEQGQNEEGLTSDITPTVSTTAVVFQTKPGVGIYSDPNSEEKAVLKVDEEKEKALQEKGQNEEGLTSDITLTVSTTAVAFQTKPGVGIYSDPNSEEKDILKVDEEKKEALQEKGQNEDGLTSNITPTVSTTAVMFQTKPGVRIYSDPNSEEKAVLKVDEEKKEVLQEKGWNEDGSTSDITPTVSTTAVAFLTKLGKRICSDPNSDRAKKVILKVDEEKKEALQEKGQNEEGLTSDITPPESTTAVVFQTTPGVRTYSDPNSEEKAILKVDEEKEKALQEKGQNEEGLTSDITPTVSTTAVMFQTTPGVRIYSDPNSEEKAILKVDEEKKEVLQEKGWNEEGLTSDITPTVSTTAVAFQTTRGVGIRSDPNSDRAKEAILKVDEEKKEALQEKGQNEEGLTSDITPTVSTTAVMFQTTRGVRIYSDPNSDWAEKAILKVDEEKKEGLQEKGQNEDGLTSDITPTVSTTAVMFQTKPGVRIYSDPNSEEKAILKVDEEKKGALQEKGQNEEGLTSDITPTVSTTAVMFQTKPGVRIYSDPNSEEKAILKVDEEKEKALQEKGQNEEGLTSNITPTVSTTAVMFQTKRGVRISSDPNSDRAEKDILKVDEEKKEALQEQGQNEDGLTSDITPTVSTTSKTTPQRKGRHRKRRQKNKSRRWKKAQRKRP